MKRDKVTIWRWETGQSKISTEDLEKLCKIYGVKLSDVGVGS